MRNIKAFVKLKCYSCFVNIFRRSQCCVFLYTFSYFRWQTYRNIVVQFELQHYM